MMFKNQKAFYADANLVAFVRPGLLINITSAQVAQDGTVSAAFTLTDRIGVQPRAQVLALEDPEAITLMQDQRRMQ
jgi:hypothetical protein